MFRKNQAQSDRLPPTQSTLYEAILCTHYQEMLVWNIDRVCCPSLPQPDDIRWEKEGDKSPLWRGKHLHLNQSSVSQVWLSKKPDAQTTDARAENLASTARTSVLSVTVVILVILMSIRTRWKLSTTTLTVRSRKVSTIKLVVNMLFPSFLEMKIRVHVSRNVILKVWLNVALNRRL